MVAFHVVATDSVIAGDANSKLDSSGAPRVSRLDVYIGDIYAAAGTGAWYAALALGLALPDICAAIEHPALPNWKRYGAWCDAFVAPRDANLTGADLWVLRCAFLHTGTAEIQEQPAFQYARLGRIYLTKSAGVSADGIRKLAVTPSPAADVRSRYSLPVGDLCEQIVGAAGAWQKTIQGDAAKLAELEKLLEIHDKSFSPP